MFSVRRKMRNNLLQHANGSGGSKWPQNPLDVENGDSE